MDTEIEVILLTLILGVSAVILKKARNRRWWVKPWLVNKNINLSLPKEFLNCGDTYSFRSFMRMNEETFNKLLGKIENRIKKNDTKFRRCISARDKLIVTLRYLATGESYKSLMYNFRIHDSTISLFVPEVCKAIYEELKNDYLQVPNTPEQWLNISQDFNEMWNLPNILGALDGKHILIQSPGEGSAYHNYKGTDSIVLLAVVDAHYNFLYVNIGTNGRLSDGGVYRESDLFSAVENNTLNFPEDRPFPNRTKKIPFVIVADAAFPLSTHIMKPFPFRNMSKEQRVFNYRLSRARRVVENTFGILANRFRILLTTIALKPKKAKVVVEACVALHNFLRSEMKSEYTGGNAADIDRRFRFVYGLSKQNGNRSKIEAVAIRNEFMIYVNGEGAVPWQDSMI